ncbi:unnamed protein product [Lathyrus sativus]|nr:unnamed protein product [Lathyrus sativus]
MEWTKVLLLDTLGKVCSGNKEKEVVSIDQEEYEYSDHLYTPPESDDDEKGVKILTICIPSNKIYKDSIKDHMLLFLTNRSLRS